MESKSYYNPDLLYSRCIAVYVTNLRPKTSQLDEIDGLQMLPPNILADIYLAVSWNFYSFLSLVLFFCSFNVDFQFNTRSIWLIVQCTHELIDCIIQQFVLSIVTWTGGLIGRYFFFSILFKSICAKLNYNDVAIGNKSRWANQRIYEIFYIMN